MWQLIAALVRAKWDPAVEQQMDLARLRHPSADR